jgi:hypothetical protein
LYLLLMLTVSTERFFRKIKMSWFGIHPLPRMQSILPEIWGRKLKKTGAMCAKMYRGGFRGKLKFVT